MADRLVEQQAIQIVEQRILIRELRERLAKFEQQLVRIA